MLEELWGGGMVLCGYRPPPAGRGTSTVATGLTHGCVWLAGCAAAAMPPFCPIVTDVRALCGCVLCYCRVTPVYVPQSQGVFVAWSRSPNWIRFRSALASPR